MNKELDYLDDILKNEPMTLNKRMIIECIKEKIQRIEAIDNAKPSEALRELENLGTHGIEYREPFELGFTKSMPFKSTKEYNTIKQALIKAQEQEKKNAYIEKIKTMMKQKDCVLRYIESEDCFAVKTILSDGWYKLTTDFVDNNVREEIKPLPLIEKNKQLKEENAEYKRVLEIIKTKDVDVFRFKKLDFNTLNQLQKSCRLPELTQEEYELLKRWLGNA